jgi:hypothetical protein
MRTFAEKPKATQPTKASKSSSVGRSHVRQAHDPSSILNLQRTIGNQAVLRLLQSNAEERNALLTGTALPHRGHDFARIPISPPKAGALQTKLAINKPGDEYEQEADRVAEQVMRMPAPTPGSPASPPVCAACEQAQEVELRRKSVLPGGAFAPQLVHHRLARTAARLQRDIGLDEIREQLVSAYLSQQDTLQRQVASPEDEEEPSAGEQILMQAKRAGVEPAEGPDLEAATAALEGGGAPLPAPVREDMEARFGQDFSRVRVHADAPGAALARRVNARAFTIGRNLVFASGEYAPNGTEDRRRLLAHELTHVIQQGQAGRRLQRKIEVAGKAFTPSAKYLSWLDANFGPAMKEFVEHMHNAGNPPVYSFTSYEQMGYEVRVRANAIKGIEAVHQGCCDYYDSAHPPYLDTTYWDHIGSGVKFRTKSPLPTGKHVSDAIAAIFAPGAGTRLECLSMTGAIEYYSMLKAIGPAKFDAQFAAGIEISLSKPSPPISGPGKKYEIVTLASKTDVLPGDWVYFKNFSDYLTRVPNGYWQGENAIYLGGGKYRGFGVTPKTETELNQELVNRYNNDGSPVLSKTVPDLIAAGGGLLLNPVVRPVISAIAP